MICTFRTLLLLILYHRDIWSVLSLRKLRCVPVNLGLILLTPTRYCTFSTAWLRWFIRSWFPKIIDFVQISEHQRWILSATIIRDFESCKTWCMLWDYGMLHSNSVEYVCSSYCRCVIIPHTIPYNTCCSFGRFEYVIMTIDRTLSVARGLWGGRVEVWGQHRHMFEALETGWASELVWKPWIREISLRISEKYKLGLCVANYTRLHNVRLPHNFPKCGCARNVGCVSAQYSFIVCLHFVVSVRFIVQVKVRVP